MIELPADEALLHPRHVARLYGVDVKTVARWAREGRLAAIQTPGGHRRYRWSHVRQVLGDPNAGDTLAVVVAGDDAVGG